MVCFSCNVVIFINLFGGSPLWVCFLDVFQGDVISRVDRCFYVCYSRGFRGSSKTCRRPAASTLATVTGSDSSWAGRGGAYVTFLLVSGAASHGSVLLLLSQPEPGLCSGLTEFLWTDCRCWSIRCETICFSLHQFILFSCLLWVRRVFNDFCWMNCFLSFHWNSLFTDVMIGWRVYEIDYLRLILFNIRTSDLLLQVGLVSSAHDGILLCNKAVYDRNKLKFQVICVFYWFIWLN